MKKNFALSLEFEKMSQPGVGEDWLPASRRVQQGDVEPRPGDGDFLMPIIRRRVLISGMVQGVAFRAYTRSTARQAGVFGWVRNLRDGRVEAVIEGDVEKVNTVIAWCRRGPSSSRVEEVKVYEERPTGEFTDFDINHSGGYFW
jgi:acylphosphatase